MEPLGPVLQSELLARTGCVRHGFTTRRGPNGEPFTMRTADGREADALANRAAACRRIGTDAGQLRFVRQVHGTHLLIADQRTPAGVRTVEADALATRTPLVPLAILVADCLPLFLVDTATPAIGLVHSGWRGTLEGIAATALAEMRRAFGTEPSRCVAWIGPGISREAFEVGPEVAGPFAERYGARWVERDGAKPHVDLKGLVAWQLVQAGLPEQAIDVSPLCTMSDPRLCSYRRDGPDTPHAMAVLELVQRG